MGIRFLVAVAVGVTGVFVLVVHCSGAPAESTEGSAGAAEEPASEEPASNADAGGLEKDEL